MGYFNIIKLNAITSTNDYLKDKRLKGDHKDGDFVWTKNQTAGRGQSNKIWQSEPENSISLSIYRAFGIKAPQHPFEISAAFACATVHALESIGVPELSIKWPNDILSCNHKVGGILIENTYKNSSLNETIMGLGLNVNQERFDSLPNAASLFTLTNKKWDLETVLNSLVHTYENVLFSNFSLTKKKYLQGFNSFLWRKRKISKFKDSEKIFEAIPLEVTQEGKLLLLDPDCKTQSEIDSATVRMLYYSELV